MKQEDWENLGKDTKSIAIILLFVIDVVFLVGFYIQRTSMDQNTAIANDNFMQMSVNNNILYNNQMKIASQLNNTCHTELILCDQSTQICGFNVTGPTCAPIKISG
jgi:hypothetical protein